MKGLLQLHSLLCYPFFQTFLKSPVPRSNLETTYFPLKKTYTKILLESIDKLHSNKQLKLSTHILAYMVITRGL